MIELESVKTDRFFGRPNPVIHIEQTDLRELAELMLKIGSGDEPPEAIDLALEPYAIRRKA